MGAQIPEAWSPGRLNFVRWPLILVALSMELASCYSSGV